MICELRFGRHRVECGAIHERTVSLLTDSPHRVCGRVRSRTRQSKPERCMTKSLTRVTLLCAAAALCLMPVGAAAQEIRVEGDHFVVDRYDGTGPQRKFLMFISYFDGLHALANGIGDLEYVANTLHFDGV